MTTPEKDARRLAKRLHLPPDGPEENVLVEFACEQREAGLREGARIASQAKTKEAMEAVRRFDEETEPEKYHAAKYVFHRIRSLKHDAILADKEGS